MRDRQVARVPDVDLLRSPNTGCPECLAFGHPGRMVSQFKVSLYCRCLGNFPPRRLAVHSDSISTIPISPVA